MFDKLLEKKGLDYASLTPEERETYNLMLSAVQQSQLTPEKLKDYITTMRNMVTQALINEPEFEYIFIFKVPNRKQILLKGRLQNYLLLEAFLSTPDKAVKAMQQTIEAIPSKS